ncbi:hypothetical protein TSUD_357550 [Trifolium subterraneum]|uniref:Uncharacterized protein n=1 Tax=Trifolium subterraneum TaxID=3900 RepID=A0A2Z6MYG6_TRISU|nr:hypothetical protein TSUD_357550 [Trifolium subterraneum]
MVDSATSSASATQPKFHSAFAISNVKIVIPITLDNDSSLYLSWSAMFQVQARVQNVLDHIIAPTDEKEKQTAEETKKNDPSLWNRLDFKLVFKTCLIISSLQLMKKKNKQQKKPRKTIQVSGTVSTSSFYSGCMPP